MQYEFLTVDVFTDRRFGGNPLAVFPDAGGLDATTMQMIAAEFNLSETVFVLPPDDPAHTARIRIFTPRAELPFAGHPNIGTAYVLARRGQAFGRNVPAALTFEEPGGLVRLTVDRHGEAIAGIELRSPQRFTAGAALPVAATAECCGLKPEMVRTDRHRPLIISCGNPFAAAELASLEALTAASARAERLAELVPASLAAGILLYVRTPGGPTELRVRMFAPLLGIPEDPASGSACVALAGLLASLTADVDALTSVAMSQGIEIGRPSLLRARAQKLGGLVSATWIGGACVAVTHGTIAMD